MTWIKTTVKTLHLLVLLLVCLLTVYNVMSHEPAPGFEDEKKQKTQALTLVDSDEANQNGNKQYFVPLSVSV
jgi:hypothetical protein